MKNPFIYFRALKHVDHTVFSVNDGQKFYYDPQFGNKVSYSSGQQVKRCIIEALNLPFAAITFNWEIDKKTGKANQKEPHSPCNPLFTDQLIGGYMKAESGTFTVKRRSPLSFSALRPIHPLLGGIENPSENLTFDRTSHPEHHNVKVYYLDEKKNRIEFTKEDLDNWLTEKQRTLPNRSFIQDQKRTSGLFVHDIAIDLRTLFCVSTNKLEPELFPDIEIKLKDAGWIEGKNIFGKCLICPKSKREEIINALAKAIVNWRITSNQARTFSLMETVAIAISDNANQIAYSIRGELRDDSERPKAEPVIDEKAKVDMFITPIGPSYIKGTIGSVDALDEAEKKLIKLMSEFDYENQLE